MKKNGTPDEIKTVNEDEFVQAWLNLKALHGAISPDIEIKRAKEMYRSLTSICPNVTKIKVRLRPGAAQILKNAA